MASTEESSSMATATPRTLPSSLVLQRAVGHVVDDAGSLSMSTDSDFVTRYYRRLRLDAQSLDDQPTLDKLRRIHEAHLAEIPFENLSQHGLDYFPMATSSAVEMAQTAATKVLDRHRGGFCYELNTLLGIFLAALGYGVRWVPVHVCDPLEDVFGCPTHVVLLVSCWDDDPDAPKDDKGRASATLRCCVYADVGLGEPPLHPLRYGKEWWNVEQRTPEGMTSKFQLIDKSQVVMYWKTVNNNQQGSSNTVEWEARLRWKYDDYANMEETSSSSSSSSHVSLRDDKGGASLEELMSGLRTVTNPACIFSQKAVVTRLTRSTKQTLAGGGLCLKTTGPPRFGGPSSLPSGVVTVTPLTSRDETRRVLAQEFGIDWQATQNLTLQASLQAPKEIFDAY